MTPRAQLFLAACLAAWPSIASAEPAAALRDLLEEAWQFELREDPLLATQVGDHRYNAELPRLTVADVERRVEAKRQFLRRADAIAGDGLARPEQINLQLFRRQLRDEIAEAEFKTYLMPITNREGFHVSFPELRRNVPLRTAGDYENYIARLEGFDRYAQDHIELMRAGIAAGVTLPAVSIDGAGEAIRPHVVADATNSVFYEPFREFPEAVPEADRPRLDAAGREAILQGIVPGYRRFLEFIESEYAQAARGTIGASALPQGREFYRHRVRSFTTLDLTPEEVHATGLAEVARIKAEMQALVKRVQFEGDLPAFIEHLRTDPKFYAATPEELLKEVAFALKRMDGELPRLFDKLPRTPYGIREIPAYIAPRTTTAYYSPPPGDGSRGGYYYVNTYDLASRPLFEVEALSLHEAVPGHHLQIALQQELEDLPPFRRFGGCTAFIEGWGLYAERLGLEVGFYQDPYSDFGRLSFEMWRACRLVVDTGIHYLGWTREQAIDFMADNTALALLNVRSEVDRYIAWPGQAVAYKIGELKIRELRGLAEAELGDRFDVRAFHAAVLESGAVPLEVLEENVHRFIAAEKSR